MVYHRAGAGKSTLVSAFAKALGIKPPLIKERKDEEAQAILGNALDFYIERYIKFREFKKRHGAL